MSLDSSRDSSTEPVSGFPAGTGQRPTRNVYRLGLVSLFADLSTEMIYPLIPEFLVTLGASKSLVGLIEGIAEGTASLLRMVGGLLSDKVRKRRLFLFAGYGLAAAAKPFLFVSTHWAQVLAVRFTDRVGKGLRTPARDALLADSVDPSRKGLGFGFHRGMDSLGAAGGPLLAMLILALSQGNIRLVFLLSVIPAAVSVYLIARVKEVLPQAREFKASLRARADLGRPFGFFVLSIVVFTLGNSSNAFLILKAREAGLQAAGIPLIWLTYNVVAALSSPVCGHVSDRIGRRPVILASFVVYAAIYAAFGLSSGLTVVWVLFCCYGLYHGLSEGIFRAYVADLVESDRRATAYGLFNTAVGLTLVPASILFGLLWDKVSSSAAFLVAAALSLAAGLVFAATQKLAPRGPNTEARGG
ncbi:MAG: MFS transporter [Candidatus Eisenbacteria bacterium]|nr:MFS transporter [Candidatus Eisenbacteria bacterium]